MKSSSVSASLSTNSLTAGILRRGVLRQLARLQRGQLVVIEGNERQVFGATGAVQQAQIHILDPAVWGMIASNGSIGAGEAFIHGYWSTPDLTTVIRVFVSNMEVLDAMEGGLAKLGRPFIPCIGSIAIRAKGRRKTSRPTMTSAMSCSNSSSTRP